VFRWARQRFGKAAAVAPVLPVPTLPVPTSALLPVAGPAAS